MPWNEVDREQYSVTRACYASELSGAELARLQPLLTNPEGRGRELADVRVILNVLFIEFPCLA